jgi:hypothetical protein
MEDCRSDAIGAVNSYIRQTRNDTSIEGYISLVIFDSQSIDTIRDRVAAGTCAELEADEYQPRGATPLLDAVGHAVALLEKSPIKDERRVLAIMTDGLENASREYTKETLKALLDRKQKEDGWLVLYLGADHDAWAQAGALGLHAGNVASFAKAAIGAGMDSVKSRAFRYAAASAPFEEAMSGGFTDEERAAMHGEPAKPTRKSKPKVAR